MSLEEINNVGQIIASAAENRKAAGRAAYNMAVASEINGNLDLALEWAQKAWTDYGNKKARDYINVIKARKNDYFILFIFRSLRAFLFFGRLGRLFCLAWVRVGGFL